MRWASWSARSSGCRTGAPTTSFQQVVGLRPGRSIVLRGLSAVAEHAWEREVVVEAAPGGGARLAHRVRVPVHRWQSRASRVSVGQGAKRFLAAVDAAMVAG